MSNSYFKKVLFISFFGHLAVFSIISFSFGQKSAKADFPDVYSLGSFLPKYDLINQRAINSWNTKQAFAFTKDLKSSGLFGKRQGSYLISMGYLKPASPLIFSEDKGVFMPSPGLTPFIQRKREQIIMFYPQLPYHFTLYFKDRQVVHIELMFNIIATGTRNSISIKRKISSGNLEVDLLSMRYIGHYLFTQQAGFAPNRWQTVKVDLSTLNNK